MNPNRLPLTTSQQALLHKGIVLFNAGQFFECHETLEEAWLEAGGEQKTFLQGLIQVAVALYHLRRDNLTGATRLLSAGMEKLAPFAPQHESVGVGDLLKDLQPLRDALRSGQAPQGWQPPKITA